MEAGDPSGAKKGALHEGRTLLYIDENGFYLLSALIKTYAPKEETPILRHKLTRDPLSVIGAIRENGKIYFGMQEHAYKSAAIIAFLEHLKRQVSGKMLLIWDGAPIHRSRAIKEYLATCEPDRIKLVPLPGYAPEVNPQEGIWRYLKYKELKNLACEDLTQLREELLQAIKRLRHKHKVIRACFAQAEKCSQT